MRIPADVEREDRVLAGLSARQLAILAAAALVLWALWVVSRGFLPLGAFAALATPLAAVATALALARRDGLSADRFALAAARYLRAPRRLVAAPEGVAPPPAWLAATGTPTPGAITWPGLCDVGAEGLVDLGTDGAAIVARVAPVNFALRAEAEQDALVAGFARLLNALVAPMQILVRAEPADVSGAVAALEDAAPSLAHPGLEAAARDHARFLADLAGRHDVWRREVFVVHRDPRPAAEAAEVLRRRAEDAAATLGAVGVRVAILDGGGAAALLARASDPGRAVPTGLGLPGAVVAGRT